MGVEVGVEVGVAVGVEVGVPVGASVAVGVAVVRLPQARGPRLDDAVGLELREEPRARDALAREPERVVPAVAQRLLHGEQRAVDLLEPRAGDVRRRAPVAVDAAEAEAPRGHEAREGLERDALPLVVAQVLADAAHVGPPEGAARVALDEGRRGLAPELAP